MENAGISLNRYARKQLRRSESLGQQIFEIGMEKEALNGLERLIKVLMKTNERENVFQSAKEWIELGTIHVSDEDIWNMIDKLS